jgi:hypothetical protein
MTDQNLDGLLWGCLAFAQVWAAACWVRPGWQPTVVALLYIGLAAMILRERHRSK